MNSTRNRSESNPTTTESSRSFSPASLPNLPSESTTATFRAPSPSTGRLAPARPSTVPPEIPKSRRSRRRRRTTPTASTDRRRPAPDR
ncbi:hypothetical protein C2S53_014787 [Perilla frutescens var. hirtella]|uniref:Uncharacterized protein n=1 Tax=Perilla frutescens var. hirtella TaxID=608512 RepID=A0AAD4NYQ8_PERFH|nr:hypothetical protein C2S53_014787 [Perilla frutescens var. hirtella]